MANPYELWTTRKLLGVFQEVKPETRYFGQFFTNGMRSDDEWIDFEKLPIRARELAPFVKPMGRGHGASGQSVQGYRFKPANVVYEDAVDPLRPLTMAPGIDYSMLSGGNGNLTPMQRRTLIKAQMLQDGLDMVERRWEWMRARAIIDGSVVCTYKDGSSVTVDFQRAAGHTEVLTSGNYWGDTGVSILDHIKEINDDMAAAPFGGVLSRVTMTSAIAAIVQADEEIREHMDVNIKGGVHTVDRGILPGSEEKVYKLGELYFAGASGRKVELWVNDETYTVNGSETRYLANNAIVATASPNAINGYECFGMIVDPDAEYQALPLFPKNFTTGDRVKVENISVESAPLFVPINPNCTYKATVTA